MSKNVIFFSNRDQVYKNIIFNYIVVISVFQIYQFIRIIINSDYQTVNRAFFIALIFLFIWTLLMQKNMRKIDFDNIEKKITIMEKTLFGLKDIYSINYSELSYEVQNNSHFWSFLIGSKSLTLLKSKAEYFEVNKSSGFDKYDISEIEKNLLEIKNTFR